jgi:adenosine deaminase
VKSFNDAQSEVYDFFYNKKNKNTERLELPKLWSILSTVNLDEFNKKDDWKTKRIPCKIGLVFTGKRHKPIREMILEAAAAATLKKSSNNNITENAKKFVSNKFKLCEIVGFDLAGKEDGFPPEKFIDEFSRLSKLHIPLTIHAGENASSEFIESAILKLGALRIGHGLSLSDDKTLMCRVREEDVCIELCPTGNHQTSHFTQSGNDFGREYPLKQYLKEGLLVCLNTDNPIISATNIVFEYFQASYSLGGSGLSLWEALRIMRMGFISSFMSLPERKHMLELVDQYLFDIFSSEEVIDFLYKKLK